MLSVVQRRVVLLWRAAQPRASPAHKCLLLAHTTSRARASLFAPTRSKRVPTADGMKAAFERHGLKTEPKLHVALFYALKVVARADLSARLVPTGQALSHLVQPMNDPDDEAWQSLECTVELQQINFLRDNCSLIVRSTGTFFCVCPGGRVEPCLTWIGR